MKRVPGSVGPEAEVIPVIVIGVGTPRAIVRHRQAHVARLAEIRTIRSNISAPRNETGRSTIVT